LGQMTDEEIERLTKMTEDWKTRMPCDWNVIVEILGDAMKHMTGLNANPKLLFVHLAAMGNVVEDAIKAEEPDFDFDELLGMAEVLGNKIVSQGRMKRQFENETGQMIDALGLGFLIPGRRP